MLRVRRTSVLGIAAVAGSAAAFLVACNDTVAPYVPPPASGGSTNATGGATESSSRNTGGAQQSSASSQGGSSQSSQSSSVATGGTSSSSTQSSGSATGGTSTTKSSSSGTSTGGTKPAGGTSSTSATTATGGRATGGSSSGTTATGGRAVGGMSSASGSVSSAGGASSKGGASATGGASTGGGSSTSASSCTVDAEKKFSFFLASKKGLVALAGSPDGFGGDLKGITGADSICQQLAEKSAPCHKGSVTWHAFLSTTTENAKDRVGKGPWYDRKGRTIALNLTNLLKDRPSDADAAIKDDLPNEDGVPNHSPEGTQVDNHEILTGTGTDGNVYTQTSTGMKGSATSCGPNSETWTKEGATCWNWTSKEGKGCPRVGHSWPRMGSGTNWISVWNEGGCAPGGVDSDFGAGGGGLDGTTRVGSAGGYGGFYCFAVTGG